MTGVAGTSFNRILKRLPSAFQQRKNFQKALKGFYWWFVETGFLE